MPYLKTCPRHVHCCSRSKWIVAAAIALLAWLLRPSVAQAGDCSASLLVPNEAHFPAAGGTFEVEVLANGACRWGASTKDGWITLINAEGRSGELLVFECAPMPSTEIERHGKIVVDGLILNVKQTTQGPARTEALRLFGDVMFNSLDRSRQYLAVDAGDRFSLAVTDNEFGTTPDVGRVAGFGRSGNSQCLPPVGMPNIATVSAGTNHSLGVTNGGDVFAWGDNASGQCDVPSDLGKCSRVSAGLNFSVALTLKHQVRCWGNNADGQCNPPDFGDDFVHQIAAGTAFVVALVSDQPDAIVNGRVVVWGSNSALQRTTAPTAMNDIVEIAAGAEHGLVRRANGSVVAWGRDREGQHLVPLRLVAKQIDAHGNSSLAVAAVGNSVAVWGELNAPFSTAQQSRFQQLGVLEARVGVDHAIVLLEVTRTLECAGSNTYFQQSGEVFIDRIAGISCGKFSFGAWNDIGRFQVFCNVGTSGSYGVCNAPVGLSRVHALALGQEHAVAIERNTRAVRVWGDNSFGQLNIPPGTNPARFVAAGERHSAVLTDDARGTIRCWGDNLSGQCNTPAFTNDSSVFARVDCGESHTLAIEHFMAGGQSLASVRIWGKWGNTVASLPPSSAADTAAGDLDGPLVNEPFIGGTPPFREVAGGGLHSLVLMADGSVLSFGAQGSGQSPTPGSVGNARSIDAGYLHSVAVSANDRCQAWGDDRVGQVHGPAQLAQVPAVAAGEFRTLVFVDTSLPLPNDIDGDGCTNGIDLGILLTVWGEDGHIPANDDHGEQFADLNVDGVVNGADLGMLLEDWYSNVDCGG